MIGGVVTSAILELLIYAVIYVLWRSGAGVGLMDRVDRMDRVD